MRQNGVTRNFGKWIELCDAHGQQCRPISLSPSEALPIWVIDVKERVLVPGFGQGMEAAPKIRGVELRLGAKDVPQLKNTADTEARLKASGGLGNQWDDIPFTTEDASSVCEALSIPYLWVDVICIKQDAIAADADDMDQFGQMSRIYQCAYINMVCAAGQDSWCGLPGTRSESRKTYQTAELVNQIRFGSFRDVRFGETRWNTRAWTFQEAILLKGILIFTDEEVIFEYDLEITWRESIVGEHNQLCSLNGFVFPALRTPPQASARQLPASGSQRSKARLPGNVLPKLSLAHRRIYSERDDLPDGHHGGLFKES